MWLAPGLPEEIRHPLGCWNSLGMGGGSGLGRGLGCGAALTLGGRRVGQHIPVAPRLRGQRAPCAAHTQSLPLQLPANESRALCHPHPPTSPASTSRGPGLSAATWPSPQHQWGAWAARRPPLLQHQQGAWAARRHTPPPQHQQGSWGHPPQHLPCPWTAPHPRAPAAPQPKF